VAEGPVQPLQRNEEKPTNSVVWENPVPQGKDAHWYRLEAPVFTGREDVNN